jgi:hypothetical protein
MRASTVILFIALLMPSTVRGQAWVPPAGDGTVAIVYQNQLVRDHLLADGTRIDSGHIASNSLLLDFTYGVTDRLALNVNIPYIATVYHGSRRHPGSLVDDGRTHGAFQDFRADVRYNVTNGRMVLTPFVDLIVPSHPYEYYGHAAPGRRLAEAQIGANVGHVITRGLPGMFVQTRLAYSFTERALGRFHDRATADFEAGYFLNPRVRVFGLTATQRTFGGIQFTHDFPRDLSPDEFRHHDQLARSDLVDAGLGLQVQLTRRTNLVGSYATTVMGHSGHAAAHSVTLGISRSFGPSFSAGDLLGDARAGGGLPRCLCQKGKSGQ